MSSGSEHRQEDPFKNWAEGEGSSKLDALDLGIQGTELYTPESTDNFPPNTPDWVRDLIQMKNNDPKHAQLAFLEMELSQRIKTGSLLRSKQSPEYFIDEAEKLASTDRLKSWNLRMATIEYLMEAAQGNADAAIRAKVLLKAIFGGDGLLAEEIYPHLLETITSSQESQPQKEKSTTILKMEQIEMPKYVDGTGEMVPAVLVTFATGEKMKFYNSKLVDDTFEWRRSVYKVGDAITLERDAQGNIRSWYHPLE